MRPVRILSFFHFTQRSAKKDTINIRNIIYRLDLENSDINVLKHKTELDIFV